MTPRRAYVGRHRRDSPCCAGRGEAVDPWLGAPLFPAWYRHRGWA